MLAGKDEGERKGSFFHHVKKTKIVCLAHFGTTLQCSRFQINNLAQLDNQVCIPVALATSP